MLPIALLSDLCLVCCSSSFLSMISSQKFGLSRCDVAKNMSNFWVSFPVMPLRNASLTACFIAKMGYALVQVPRSIFTAPEQGCFNCGSYYKTAEISSLLGIFFLTTSNSFFYFSCQSMVRAFSLPPKTAYGFFRGLVGREGNQTCAVN